LSRTGNEGKGGPHGASLSVSLGHPGIQRRPTGSSRSLALGQSKYYRPCHSIFPCGSPYATTSGAEPIIKRDLTRARQLVKESGYAGRPVVVIHATDFPFQWLGREAGWLAGQLRERSAREGAAPSGQAR